MTSEITIRAYQSADRTALRRICCATADRGGPLDNIYSDGELVADLVTCYYTDFEPAYSWVAVSGGQVIGYLTAAPDTRKSERVLLRSIVPGAIVRAILRGALWRAETWRMVAALNRNRKGFAQRRLPAVDAYPAHLHIDILNGFRGQRVGERLIRTCLERLAASGIKGVHATVRADNAGACKFFERMGFCPLRKYDSVLPSKDGSAVVAVIIYGRQIGTS